MIPGHWISSPHAVSVTPCNPVNLSRARSYFYGLKKGQGTRQRPPQGAGATSLRESMINTATAKCPLPWRFACPPVKPLWNDGTPMESIAIHYPMQFGDSSHTGQGMQYQRGTEAVPADGCMTSPQAAYSQWIGFRTLDPRALDTNVHSEMWNACRVVQTGRACSRSLRPSVCFRTPLPRRPP